MPPVTKSVTGAPIPRATYAISGVSGDADACDADFIASLTGSGPVNVASDFWVNIALAQYLKAHSETVSMRLLNRVLMPSTVFSENLDATSAPFYMKPARLSTFSRALLVQDMPLDPVDSVEDLAALVATFADKLAPADRVLSTAD